MSVFINYISYYLPQSTLSNKELEKEYPEWTVDKISSKTGIFQRHIAAPNEFASDLAFKAAEKLFLEYNIEKNEIDYLLLCTQSPDYFLPTTACIVQDRLGLNKSIGAIDINQGCSGFIYSLGLAKGLILSQQSKNVLIITTETYSKYIHTKDKSNKTLFGDGAAAILLSDKSIGLSAKINNFIYGTDGSGYENLIVRNGASRNRFLNDIDVYEDGEFYKNNNNLFMDGRAIFQFTLTTIPKLVERMLERDNINLNEVDKFVFHQANKFMLDKIRIKLNIPQEKFVFNSEYIGNTVSSTIPISLKELIKSNKIKNGEKILLVGFGVGLSYGAVLVTIQQ